MLQSWGFFYAIENTMTTFTLIRHGQTDWNLVHRLQGHMPIPLNEEGYRQAHAAMNRLDGRTFDAIYSSDLLRAAQTAGIIAGKVKAPIIQDTRLREISHGRWEGHTVLEAGDLFPEDVAPWSRNMLDFAIPGGETVLQVAERITDFLNEISQKHPDQNVLIVSHGFAIGMMICLANRYELTTAYMRIPGNTEIVEIQWPIESV